MWTFLSAELRRFGNTVTWSIAGWRQAWATEKSLRQWTIVHIASMALALWLPLAAGERALIFGLGFLLLAAELFNSAIEAVVDMVSPEIHPLAKKAKDCGSAGVALVGLGGLAAWIFVLFG